MHLTGWGKYPGVDSTLANPRDQKTLEQTLEQAASCIARGNGRSYGDSSLNDTEVVSCLHLDHMESFDEESGILVAEAGVTLADILDAFVPRGWFLPVTPGTKFITLGGALAADVHGKNHHVTGTFSLHVPWFEIWTPALGVLRCSPAENPDVYHATPGGHGLTGFITRVAVKLQRIPSGFIAQETVKAGNLAEIMHTFEECGDLPFSVAWIDCLKTGPSMGRSIFMGGRFLEQEELPKKHHATPFAPPCPYSLSVPFDFPGFALNPYSVKAFNAAYYGKAPKGRITRTVTYNTFFYPLDAVHDWNRIYGKRGFIQYQFVIPRESAAQGLAHVLNTIAESRQGAFLAVLKLFGSQPEFGGNISFPTEGYTLALDFAVNDKVFPLLDRLDAMVLDYGGRHYLAKDARMSAATFRRSYGAALESFMEIQSRLDPNRKLASLQSRRLGITR